MAYAYSQHTERDHVTNKARRTEMHLGERKREKEREGNVAP